jgi:sulfur-oxidizing protein SoxZ
VPAWFIKEVTAAHNGKQVLRAEWSPSIAKNPYMQFVVLNAKAGDRVSVTWIDNKGGTRTDNATVS